MKRSSRWLVVAALVAVVGPQRAWGQDPEPGTDAPAEEGAQTVEPPEAPSSGVAQPPSDVEVIRIKGRAVTGIQTEVPTSITQFDAAEIQNLGAQNISDLAKVTPNVEIKTAGSTAPTFFIRGVGLSDFSANAAGAVAIYREDVPINAPAIQLTPLFDLENVEVLRGPQSTGTGGRNASGGSIKIYSRKPSGGLGAELKSTFGNYDARDFEGAIEAPLVEEVLASRLAFRWSERGPIGKNRCGGVNAGLEDRLPPLPPTQPTNPAQPRIRGPNIGPSFCGEAVAQIENPRYLGQYPEPPGPLNVDALGNPRFVSVSRLPNGLPSEVNDLGNWSARGTFRLQPPGTEMDWLLNLHGTRVDQLSTLGQAMGTRSGYLGSATQTNYTEPDNARELLELGGNTEKLGRNLAEHLDIRPFKGDYDLVGKTKLDTWGAALHGDWPLGPVTLVSVTGYDTYDRSRATDQDFTPDVLFENVSSDNAWQVFQELRAEGELTELPFRWNLGGYYLKENLEFGDVATFLSGVNVQRRDYVQETGSYAVYAGFAWDFLDDFTLEGGVRWNHDRKDFDFAVVGNVTTSRRSQQRLEDSAPTGGLTLSYRFNEEVSGYWKYSRGWKPGTFNSIATELRNVKPAEPETIDAWETGLRGSWLDGRLDAGVALFYYKYANYQVFVVVDEPLSPPALEIQNASDAQVYGAELDLRLEPLADLVPPALEGLVVSTRAGWLESKFLDFTTQVVRQVGFFRIPVTIDYSGNQLINSPRFKVSLAAEWTIDLERYGALIPRYDFAWSSDTFFDANEGRGSPDTAGVGSLPEFGAGQAAFWLHNVRLGYRVPEGNIEIAGWCRNVTDKVYKTYAFDASSFSNVVINFVGEPRTYGLDFTVRF